MCSPPRFFQAHHWPDRSNTVSTTTCGAASPIPQRSRWPSTTPLSRRKTPHQPHGDATPPAIWQPLRHLLRYFLLLRRRASPSQTATRRPFRRFSARNRLGDMEPRLDRTEQPAHSRCHSTDIINNPSKVDSSSTSVPVGRRRPRPATGVPASSAPVF